MGKLEKIKVDWKKRFKNLYVDTSNAKNFLRLDWTKKSRERKKQFNKEVDYVISYASALSEVHNNMVDLLDKLISEYNDSEEKLLIRP